MDGLDEKAFGSLGWPDIDEISDFWIHDKKILEFKIRNSESLLLGPVRHREVQLLQGSGALCHRLAQLLAQGGCLLRASVPQDQIDFLGGQPLGAPGMSRREWGSPPIVTYRKVEQLYLPEERFRRIKGPAILINDIFRREAILIFLPTLQLR